jgi:hypothetical protein
MGPKGRGGRARALLRLHSSAVWPLLRKDSSIQMPLEGARFLGLGAGELPSRFPRQ